jgi:short-subunit dehydrogenase
MVLNHLVYILAAVGILSLASRILSGANLFNQFFLRRGSFSRYVSSDHTCPTWALVTGSSDGIGLAFARELCVQGVNVILHGRNQAKLMRVKTQLLSSFPNRRIEVFVFDAAQQDGKESINAFVESVRSLPDGGVLRILVNNVGGANNLIGKGVFRPLEDTTLDQVDKLININARFPALLTTALLPILTSSNNTPTLVLNIGSFAAIASLPYTVVYSASKAFNLIFSKSLAAEMMAQGKNVEVIGFIVGSVDTPGAPKDDDDALFSIDPDTMARNALNLVGCRKEMVFSHWKHWLTHAIMQLMPRSMILSMMKRKWQDGKKTK